MKQSSVPVSQQFQDFPTRPCNESVNKNSSTFPLISQTDIPAEEEDVTLESLLDDPFIGTKVEDD
jgi:hypothetical protein